jgi:hypothetical protein
MDLQIFDELSIEARRRNYVRLKRLRENLPQRSHYDDQLARTCFNIDRQITVKELRALHRLLIDKAMAIEMLAAERVFSARLNEKLAGKARLLRKVARELEPLRRAAAKARPPCSAAGALAVPASQR